MSRLIVLTGPSGVGKGTLLQTILKRHPDLYVSISATTRSPRPGEVDGQHYHFLTRPEFERKVAQGEFLEWAEFAGNLYGTLRPAVEEQLRQGKRVILEIELAGARQIRKTFPEAMRIFILPPSIHELESRIRHRGTESDEAIARRLARAQAEIDAASEFDLQIINDDFDHAIEQIESALFATAAC